MGEILVSTGVLPQEDVLQVLRIRTLDIIYDLFLWEEAHFELYDNEEPPDYFIRIEVPTTKVIMDGIYRIEVSIRYSGFRKLVIDKLNIRSGQTVAIDLTLTATGEVVGVIAEPDKNRP